jgi:hypothetical protein
MQILRLCARHAAATVVLLSALATIAGAAACSFIISADLPTFTCVAGEAYVCPSGQVCSPNTSTCVPECTPDSCGAGECVSGLCVALMADGGTDGTMGDDGLAVDHDAQAAADADAMGDAGTRGNDGEVPCTGSGFGCKCTTTASCPPEFACVDKLAVTADIWNACIDAGGGGGWDGGSGGVCMKPCCTSGDCDMGDGGMGDSVCFATGAGGNYCVPPGWLGDRSTIGTNVGGGACGGDAGACRSGLCLSGSNVCADTCCSNHSQTYECAANVDCRFDPFPGTGFDTHEAAQCMAGPPSAGRCQMNADCRSNLCFGAMPDSGFMNSGTCQDACRNSIDCTPTGMMRSQTCSYVQPNFPMSTELVAACTQQGFGQGDGGAGDGSQCRVSADCARGSCVQSNGQGVCITACFGDMDCPQNERCRPQAVQLLGAPHSVLACGT